MQATKPMMATGIIWALLRDNTYRYYSNGDYYNYEVAQHTEGYIKWADKNGWPMTGGALGRVRR